MGRISLDRGAELGSHRAHDALTHAGRTRIAFCVQADAVVRNRQDKLVIARRKIDMDRTGAVGIGVFHRVHHQLVDDDSNRNGAVRIDLDRFGFQRQARHLIAFGRSPQIFEQGVEILVQHHALQVVRRIEPAVNLGHGGNAPHGVGERGLDVIFRG